MESLKFAIAGCGNIGRRHLEILMNESAAKVTAVCDIDSGVREDILGKHPAISVYSDYGKMLREGDFEVITICTPHGLHAPMSIEAARHKKHILVEKPMALNTSDSKKMIEAAEENDVRLFVVKQNRFNRPIFATKKALDAGALGKIYMVQCNVFWNRNSDYYKRSSWRGDRALEGGALFTQASHFLDLLVWWFDEIKDVKSISDTLHHKIEIEDCGIACFRFRNGALGSINWTTSVYNVNYEGSITIIGEKGTIKIGGKYLNTIDHWDVMSYPQPTDSEEESEPNIYPDYKGSSSNHDKLFTRLIEEIIHERKGLVEGDEGLRSIEAIEKIYRSADR